MASPEKLRREREKEAYRREEIERQERRKYEDALRARLKREEEQKRLDKLIIIKQREKKNREIAEIEQKSAELLKEAVEKQNSKEPPKTQQQT